MLSKRSRTVFGVLTTLLYLSMYAVIWWWASWKLTGVIFLMHVLTSVCQALSLATPVEQFREEVGDITRKAILSVQQQRREENELPELPEL